MADSPKTTPAILKQKYDFAAPHVRATIIKEPNSATPTRFPLWTSDKPIALDGYTAGGKTSPSSISSLAYLSSATVEMELNCIPKLTVSLTPPFLEARKFIDSTILDWGRSVLEIELGYVGSKEGTFISRPYTGIIQKPDVSFGSDITVGLTAQGQAAFYLAGNPPIIKDDAPPQAHSRANWIIYIVTQFKEQKITTTRANWLVSPAAEVLLNQVAKWTMSSLSALNEIYNFARSCGCYLNLVGNEVQIISFDYLINDDPKLTLRLYDYDTGQVGPQNGVYPILSVTSDSPQIFLGMDVKGMLYKNIDNAQKKQQVAQGSPNKGIAVSGATTGQAGYTNDPQQQVMNSAIAGLSAEAGIDNATAQQLVNTAMTKDAQLGVSLTVETLGIPDILPGFKVKVVGVSERIDGAYSVYSIKHDISSSGFTTSLTLKANFASLTTSLNTTYNAAAFNAPPADPPTSTGSDTPKAPAETPRREKGTKLPKKGGKP
jgi:hypothetical protein